MEPNRNWNYKYLETEMLKNFKMEGMKCVVTEKRTGKEANNRKGDYSYPSTTHYRSIIYDDGILFMTVSRPIKGARCVSSANVISWEHESFSYKLVEYTDGRHVFLELDGKSNYIFGDQKHLISNTISKHIMPRIEKKEPSMEITFKVNGKEQSPTTISKETWLWIALTVLIALQGLIMAGVIYAGLKLIGGVVV